MSARAASPIDRNAIYAKLEARNRIVSILRFGVPGVAAFIVGIIILQLWLVSIGRELGIASLLIDRDSILVDAPRYAGVMLDGTSYLLTARSAKAPVNGLDKIDLTDADFLLTRADGSVMTIKAPSAKVDTTKQSVIIDSTAYVTNSDGTRGTMDLMFIDWRKQLFSADGAVHLIYPNGMRVDGIGMHFDPLTRGWQFGKSTITVPQLPGSDALAKDLLGGTQ